MSSDQADKISQKTGLSQDQLTQVISAGLPMIVGTMAQNSTSQSGAASLNNALNKHVNSPVLSSSDAVTSDATIQDGGNILGHIFGGGHAGAANQVSQKTGVDAATVMKVMAMLAPLVMAYLAKKRSGTSTNSSAADITSILGSLLGSGQTSTSSSSGTAMGGLLGNILGALFGKK